MTHSRNKRIVLATLFSFVGLSSARFTAAAQLGDFPGNWQMRGYGQLFKIDNANLTIYDTTDIGCIWHQSDPLKDANAEWDRVTADDDSLSLFEAGGVTQYVLDGGPDNDLPVSCQNATPAAQNDPLLNFDSLWEVFRENYAFFSTHHVDWDAMRAKYRPKITPTTSRQALFDIFKPMLQALNDGHVGLAACDKKPCDEIDSGGPGELLALWTAGGGDPDNFDTAVENYVDNTLLQGKGQTDAGDNFTWGWLDSEKTIGYLNIPSMELTDADGDSLETPEELALIDEVLPRIVSQFAHARALIVDARFNDGGDDSVALQIMGYLTPQAHHALTKKARWWGHGYTQPQDIWYAPHGAQQFSGPVYYLQSGTTISAGETFTLAMKAAPNVTRIGTRTWGAFSDQLEKTLPNRWTVTISNEIYSDPAGVVYEGRGVPPDVPVDTSNKTFYPRLQLDIDAALMLIDQQDCFVAAASAN